MRISSESAYSRLRLSWLRSVASIRFFEESLAEIYGKGLVRCPVHLAIGHEASAVGVCSALTRNDKVLSYHRSHHHFLAKGGDPGSLLRELLGNAQGCSGGRGGSTHLHAPEAGFMGSTAIISGILPVATGLAHGELLAKTGNVVVAFCGDAAPEEGVFFESLNLASLWNLPLLIVIEDNDLSCYSPKHIRQSVKGIGAVAEAYGIPHAEVDGSRVSEVYEAAETLVSSVRANSRPALLRASVFRAHEHCGPDRDDELSYRRVAGEWPERDPLRRLSSDFSESEAIPLLEEIRGETRKLFRKILKELGHDSDL